MVRYTVYCCWVLSIPVTKWRLSKDTRLKYCPSRIHTYFYLSEHWKDYDPFSRKKQSTIEGSRSAMFQHARVWSVHHDEFFGTSQQTQFTQESEKAELKFFRFLCKTSLFSEIDSSTKPFSQLSKTSRLLVNDMDQAYNTLKKVRESGKTDRTVNIILSSAGYELLTDLILASFLLRRNFATRVVLQPSSIPFNMSCTAKDYESLLDFLASSHTNDQEFNSDTKLQQERAVRLGEHLRQLQTQNELVIQPHNAWHLSTSYWHIPSQHPALFQELQDSELVVFKGDFHYRKLVFDVRNLPSKSRQSLNTILPSPLLLNPNTYLSFGRHVGLLLPPLRQPSAH